MELFQLGNDNVMNFYRSKAGIMAIPTEVMPCFARVKCLHAVANEIRNLMNQYIITFWFTLTMRNLRNAFFSFALRKPQREVMIPRWMNIPKKLFFCSICINVAKPEGSPRKPRTRQTYTPLEFLNARRRGIVPAAFVSTATAICILESALANSKPVSNVSRISVCSDA